MEKSTDRASLTVSIVNWNAGDLIIQCVTSIFNTIRRYPFEIVIVDNNSSDGSVQKLEETFPSLKIIKNKCNVGYARAHNQVLKTTESEYVLLLNPDVILLEKAVDLALDFMAAHEEVGMAVAKVVSEDGSVQQTLVSFPSLKTDLARLLKSYIPCFGTSLGGFIHKKAPKQSYDEAAPVFSDEAVTGPFLLLRKRMLEDIGYMDEAFFLFSEENDLCIRAKREGWKRVYLPNVTVVHLLGICREKAPRGFSIYHFHRSRIIFYSKHYGTLKGLSLRLVFFSVALIDISVGLIKRLVLIFTGKTAGRDLIRIDGFHIMKAVFHSF